MPKPAYITGRMLVYILLLLIVLLTMWQVRRCTPQPHPQAPQPTADSIVYHNIVA